MKLFISYRRKSWSFVQLLEEKLKVTIKGDIFVDYKGIDDTNFERSILRHLRESNLVLVVVTELTFEPKRIQNEKDWVRREIALALELNKPIILILVDNLLPPTPSSLPTDIRNVTQMQGIAFYQDYFEEAVQKLATFINKVVPSTRHLQDSSALRNAIQQYLKDQGSASPPEQNSSAFGLTRGYATGIGKNPPNTRMSPHKTTAQWVDEGNALNELKRYTEALSAHEQAIHLDPSLPLPTTTKALPSTNWERKKGHNKLTT